MANLLTTDTDPVETKGLMHRHRRNLTSNEVLAKQKLVNKTLDKEKIKEVISHFTQHSYYRFNTEDLFNLGSLLIVTREANLSLDFLCLPLRSINSMSDRKIKPIMIIFGELSQNLC
jgi:hypothetical protein